MSTHRSNAEIADEDRRILALRARGLRCREIADQLGIRETSVWRCARRHGVAIVPHRVDPTPGTPGAILREQRKAAGLSVTEFAGRVGCTTSAIYMFETNVRGPSRHIARRIRETLGLATPIPRGAFSVYENGDGIIRVLLTSPKQRGPVMDALRGLGGVVL